MATTHTSKHAFRVTIGRGRSRLILLMLTALTCLLAGCSLFGSGDTSPTPAEPTLPPTETVTAAGSGLPAELESSIALVRQAGEPDEIRGSAVVMSSDGRLVTSAEVASDDIEVVLPDGQVHRPVLVSVEPELGLALLKVPADRLVPVRYSTQRLSDDTEVFATGFDGSPGSIGRMGGHVVGAIESDGIVDYRVRGPLLIDTDINLVSGFVGGALSDGDGGFAGVLVSMEERDGEPVTRVVSNWAVLGWLETREEHRADLAEASSRWDSVSLRDGWSVRIPEGWTLDVTADDESTYRAELVPENPDASLQLSISAEPNGYGTDPEAFVRELFEDRSNATLWGVTRVDGNPLVRLTLVQEGASIDVAYLLDPEYAIAVSMTSGYQMGGDQAQVEEARALFGAVLDSLSQ